MLQHPAVAGTSDKRLHQTKFDGAPDETSDWREEVGLPKAALSQW